LGLFSYLSASSQCLYPDINGGNFTITNLTITFFGNLRIPAGTTLLINGTSNVTFTNLQLQLGDGAKIELDGTATLNVINSRLYNCTPDTWDCLELLSSNCALTYGRSTLQGSDNGIRNTGGGDIDLIDSYMFNNYIHLGLYAGTSATNCVISGTDFICDPVATPMAFSTVYPTQPRTLFAIEIFNANYRIIGDASYNTNTIDNADIGIRIWRTGCEIYNFIINNCDDRTAGNEAAILASSPITGGIVCDLIVGGFAASEKVQIFDSESGIRVSNWYNVTAYNNYIEDVTRHGIFIADCPSRNIDLQANIIDMDYTPVGANAMAGIFTNNNGNANILIHENIVKLNNLPQGNLSRQAFGIRTDEASNLTPTVIKITDNNVYDFSIGIQVRNTFLALVTGDSITIPDNNSGTQARIGINSEGNDRINIVDNRVLSTGNFLTHRGIFDDQGTNAIIRCNRVWDGGRQIFLNGTTMIANDGFMGNGMVRQSSGANFGLQLQAGASIGTNGGSGVPSDNHWETPFNTLCLQDPPLTASGVIYHRPNVSSDVFDPYGAGCSNIPNTTTSISFVQTTSSSYYCPSGELMRQGDNDPYDPSLFITYDNAVNYINALVNKPYQTIWDLQNAARLFDLGIIPSGDSLEVAFNNLPFANEAIAMNAINNLMSDSAFTQASDLIQSNTWNLEGFAYKAWMNSLKITNPIDSAGNYSQSVLDTLTLIAGLCPYIYGSAVFEARAILQWDYVEESEECQQASLDPDSYIRYGSGNNYIKQNNLLVYPQPLAQGRELTITSKTESISEITIINLFGNIEFNEKGIWVNTVKIRTDFESGMYFIQVKLSSGDVIVQKVIVQ